MEEYIKKVVELDIDLDDLELENMGVDVVSFVTDPAIAVDFMAFKSEEFVEPKSGETESEFISRCIPILIGEGKEQDQAISICYSYWENKEFEYNPSALPPYVDQDEEVKVKASCGCNHSFGDEEYTAEQRIILEWAEENGEVITEEYTYIKEGEQFNTVADVAKAIQGLDILSKLGITSGEPAERKYRYTGPSAERGFCRAMMRLNKMYSDSDMRALEGKLSTVNPGMGPRGANNYDVFKYKGSVNCRHYWTQLAVFRPEGGSRVLVIDQGPASGDAGKSNNANYPSPAGAVANNARYGFSIMSDEKRIVAGALMIPNQMILRRDENGEPYYVYFSVDTIKRIQERFNREHKHNYTDTQHDGEILTDNILLEQWLVEHPVYDKSRFYGFDRLPAYTWFGVYKVKDDETWDRIKSGELRGFSIAGNFIERAKKVNEDEQTLSKILDILSKIK